MELKRDTENSLAFPYHITRVNVRGGKSHTTRIKNNNIRNTVSCNVTAEIFILILGGIKKGSKRMHIG